jgi:hypothetical protein
MPAENEPTNAPIQLPLLFPVKKRNRRVLFPQTVQSVQIRVKSSDALKMDAQVQQQQQWVCVHPPADVDESTEGKMSGNQKTENAKKSASLPVIGCLVRLLQQSPPSADQDHQREYRRLLLQGVSADMR